MDCVRTGNYIVYPVSQSLTVWIVKLQIAPPINPK